MKFLTIIITTCVFALVSCNQDTAYKKATFKVWGNCEMCKETIEGSLNVEGVAKAEWSTESKMIVVNYDSTKINLDQIQKNIEIVGYDNEKYKVDEKAYSNLPECCQYDRK